MDWVQTKSAKSASYIAGKWVLSSCDWLHCDITQDLKALSRKSVKIILLKAPFSGKQCTICVALSKYLTILKDCLRIELFLKSRKILKLKRFFWRLSMTKRYKDRKILGAQSPRHSVSWALSLLGTESTGHSVHLGTQSLGARSLGAQSLGARSLGTRSTGHWVATPFLGSGWGWKSVLGSTHVVERLLILTWFLGHIWLFGA